MYGSHNHLMHPHPGWTLGNCWGKTRARSKPPCLEHQPGFETQSAKDKVIPQEAARCEEGPTLVWQMYLSKYTQVPPISFTFKLTFNPLFNQRCQHRSQTCTSKL
jgi:hypothetical protein